MGAPHPLGLGDILPWLSRLSDSCDAGPWIPFLEFRGNLGGASFIQTGLGVLRGRGLEIVRDRPEGEVTCYPPDEYWDIVAGARTFLPKLIEVAESVQDAGAGDVLDRSQDLVDTCRLLAELDGAQRDRLVEALEWRLDVLAGLERWREAVAVGAELLGLSEHGAGDRVAAARTFALVGRCRAALGEVEEAVRALLRARELCASVNENATSDRLAARVCLDLGLVFEGEERLAEAVDAADGAVEAYRHLAEAGGEEVEAGLGDALACLGRVLVGLGRLDDASEVLREAVAVYQVTTARHPCYLPVLARTQMDFAEVLRCQGFSGDSKRERWDALRLFEYLSLLGREHMESWAMAQVEHVDAALAEGSALVCSFVWGCLEAFRRALPLTGLAAMHFARMVRLYADLVEQMQIGLGAASSNRGFVDVSVRYLSELLRDEGEVLREILDECGAVMESDDAARLLQLLSAAGVPESDL